MLSLDTHILLYALTGDLTKREASLLSGDGWSISAIVLWEISKLSELKRIELDLDHPELVRSANVSVVRASARSSQLKIIRSPEVVSCCEVALPVAGEAMASTAPRSIREALLLSTGARQPAAA